MWTELMLAIITNAHYSTKAGNPALGKRYLTHFSVKAITVVM